jgi:hypothetical protein
MNPKNGTNTPNLTARFPCLSGQRHKKFGLNTEWAAELTSSTQQLSMGLEWARVYLLHCIAFHGSKVSQND